jgi:hypothetical protein
MLFQHWSIIPTVDLETHWSGMSQFFLWRRGKGSRMVSFMYQSVIQHPWPMDSISERIDVALHTEGQLRSNKASNNVAGKYNYLMLFPNISPLVYHANNWFGNTGPLQEVKVLNSLTHECIIEYIKFWMFSWFFKGGKYHFRIQFRT